MPIDLTNKPVLSGRGYSPAPERPFDPSQLTDAKAQIEYLVNTGKMSVADANAALKPYGAKLSLQESNRGRGPGGRDYYQITGSHSLLKEFVLPASLMVGAGVGVNLLANALAAGAGAAGASSAATPSLGSIGASGSVPTSIAAGGPGVGLGAAPAAAGAVPAAGATIGPGVSFGGATAAGTPGIAGPAGSTAATVGAKAGIGSQLARAGIGFAADAFKQWMANRASSATNKDLQHGIAQAQGVYKDALGPYMNLGQLGAGNLGYLMGNVNPAGATAPMALPAVPPGASLGTMGRSAPPGAEISGPAMPRPPAPTAMVDPRGAMGGGGSLGTMGMMPEQAMMRSSFVRMVAPDGEVGDVPFEMVARAKQMGAQEFRG